MISQDFIGTAIIRFTTFHINEYRKRFFEDCDLICYYGGITNESIDFWNSQISHLNNKKNKKDKLTIFLYTTGGSVEVVEKLVEMTRRFYLEVYFVIPDFAMSAGTIWVMSGNKIYMSYSSSLGPIDPQVQSSDGRWVPALGYLDKANEIIKKSAEGKASQAELMMLNQLDLAVLRRYEQAVELSVELLIKWLTKYKFSQWERHESNPIKKGKPVTKKEKEARAKNVAKLLSDNKIWHSHGRFISIQTARDVLKLKIDDYTENDALLKATDELHTIILQSMQRNGLPLLVFIADDDT